MICKACNKVPSSPETEDCFEKALDIIKQHYTCKLKIKHLNKKL